MKTLETIIEQEIKRHIDDLEVCSDIIAAGTEDPNRYDSIITYASDLAEDIIRTNIKYILHVAHNEYDEMTQMEEDNPEQEDTDIDIEIDKNISEEDLEMLRFIQS